jgi:hypothetical protein
LSVTWTGVKRNVGLPVRMLTYQLNSSKLNTARTCGSTRVTQKFVPHPTPSSDAVPITSCCFLFGVLAVGVVGVTGVVAGRWRERDDVRRESRCSRSWWPRGCIPPPLTRRRGGGVDEDDMGRM